MKTTTPIAQPHPLFIRRSQLKSVLGLSPSTVDRLEAEGLFPRRRRIGPGCVGWFYDEAKEAITKSAVVVNKSND